ncbi:M23 family metallopeptidase [Accumulibacter sp.]|uniref:M23 family metallopeptidase n=1 Tax=Accumulibacter sp. TaxID=2053492 RepID=UPI001A403037|nr:M23 family metallopeptidase [Accumulibacter sp.]MBL8374529.1 M23 family metallopeptidase [Accumulibacter sp.]
MVSTGSRLLLGMLVLGMLPGFAAAAPSYPFSVTSEAVEGRYHFVAHNRGPAPVSVRLTMTVAENVRTSRDTPVYAVVRPNTDSPLLQVSPALPGGKFRFASETAHAIGNYLAQADARAVYRLPFEKGRSFMVGQSHDGPRLTHTTVDSEHAVDFIMPVNTPVVAARDGVVIGTESAHRAGGDDRQLFSRANFVRVLHGDDTIATYAHLAPGGVSVAVGQKVKAGTVIGRSGATGYTLGPHLHFVVQGLVGDSTGFMTVSVPIRFSSGDPPRAFTPRYRQTVTAN